MRPVLQARSPKVRAAPCRSRFLLRAPGRPLRSFSKPPPPQCCLRAPPAQTPAHGGVSRRWTHRGMRRALVVGTLLPVLVLLARASGLGKGRRGAGGCGRAAVNLAARAGLQSPGLHALPGLD